MEIEEVIERLMELKDSEVSVKIEYVSEDGKNDSDKTFLVVAKGMLRRPKVRKWSVESSGGIFSMRFLPEEISSIDSYHRILQIELIKV